MNKILRTILIPKNINKRNFFNYATKEDINNLRLEFEQDITLLRNELKQDMTLMSSNNKIYFDKITKIDNHIKIFSGVFGTIFIVSQFADKITGIVDMFGYTLIKK